MGDHAGWILLPFAIVMVAALARLSSKLEELKRRLDLLEPPGVSDDEIT
jgi:hypothetical protein